MGMNGAGLGCGGAPEPFVEDVEDVVGPRVQMGGLCLPAGLLLTLAVAAKHDTERLEPRAQDCFARKETLRKREEMT